jgi:hypothetical protein
MKMSKLSLSGVQTESCKDPTTTHMGPAQTLPRLYQDPIGINLGPWQDR